MTRAFALVAIAAGFNWVTPVLAQELPRWSLAQTCAKETDPACRALERNAYSFLSGEWRSLPAEPKAACLEDAKSFGHTSYRMLRLCLDDEIAKQRDSASEDRESPEWVSDGLRLLYR